jgi:hypothetical protein
VISRRQQKKNCNNSTSTTTTFLVAAPAVFAYQFDAGPGSQQQPRTKQNGRRQVLAYTTPASPNAFSTSARPPAGSSQHTRTRTLSFGNSGLLSLSPDPRHRPATPSGPKPSKAKLILLSSSRILIIYHVPETVLHSEHVIFFLMKGRLGPAGEVRAFREKCCL